MLATSYLKKERKDTFCEPVTSRKHGKKQGNSTQSPETADTRRSVNTLRTVQSLTTGRKKKKEGENKERVAAEPQSG